MKYPAKKWSSHSMGMGEIMLEVNKNRETSSKTILILDYEQRLIADSSKSDKIKYSKEIMDLCKSNKNINSLSIQNEVIYLTVNKDIYIKIAKDSLNNIKIDNHQLFMALVRGIASKYDAISRLKNHDEWNEDDPLNIRSTALCYVLNIHPDKFKHFIHLLKRSIAFKICIDYTDINYNQESSHE